MTRDQKIVGVGAASGVAAMIASMAGIYQLWPCSLSLVDISTRLAYTLQANAFAVIPSLAGIVAIGNNRFLSEAIDPTLQKEDAATQINGRVVDNTLQQFVLFLVATTALSVNLTPAQMRIIPAAAIVFVMARAAFWVGYLSTRSTEHLEWRRRAISMLDFWDLHFGERHSDYDRSPASLSLISPLCCRLCELVYGVDNAVPYCGAVVIARGRVLLPSSALSSWRLSINWRGPPSIDLGYASPQCAAAVDKGFKRNPLRGEDALRDHTG